MAKVSVFSLVEVSRETLGGGRKEGTGHRVLLGEVAFVLWTGFESLRIYNVHFPCIYLQERTNMCWMRVFFAFQQKDISSTHESKKILDGENPGCGFYKGCLIVQCRHKS